MPADRTPVIAASARWLLSAYPATGGAFSRALAEAQARQATELAAHLRYPTAIDVELLHLLTPGGSDRLDRLTGHSRGTADGPQEAWRSWVDEAVVSWAACLLADPALAARARDALAAGDALADTDRPADPGDPRRLTRPGDHDTEATALLRHPDLLEPLAALHGGELAELLSVQGAGTP